MSRDSPTLPFTRREIELLTKPMPVIDLEKLKPTPIRLRSFQALIGSLGRLPSPVLGIIGSSA